MGGKPRGDQRREKPSESPVMHLTFAGLHQMGCTADQIIDAMGLDRDSRFLVDRMVNLYNMLYWGLPKGAYGETTNPVECPRCRTMVQTVPCVKCMAQGAWPSRLRDVAPNIEDF